MASSAGDEMGQAQLWGESATVFRVRSPRVGDVNPVTAVVGQGWPKVPAGDTVWRPGGALGGGLVRKDAAAWWAQRGLVEIKRAMDLCVSGETRVDV